MSQEQQQTKVPDLPCEANPDLWFATRDEAVFEAVRVCHQCPVMRACRAFAISHDEPYGTWGGSTEKQRDEARKVRKSAEGQVVHHQLTAAREAAAA